MEKIYTTKSYKETQKLGERLAKEIVKKGLQKEAVVLSLKGNLGGGKTTFLQGFAKGLEIKEKILSPTFVILKRFKISIRSNDGRPSIIRARNFYHIDCYRLKDSKDILELDFKKMILNPENIIAVEWPEKIKEVLPKKMITINFKFVDQVSRREIIFKM